MFFLGDIGRGVGDTSAGMVIWVVGLMAMVMGNGCGLLKAAIVSVLVMIYAFCYNIVRVGRDFLVMARLVVVLETAGIKE